MAEFSVPPLVPETTTGNTASFAVEHATHDPDRVLFSRLVNDRWTDITAQEFLDDVTGVARGLIAAGIKPGDRVALMSRTRYEWTLVDFAIWSTCAITVPIYETSSADQVRWILQDSGATACVVETPDHAKTVGAVRGELPALSDVWQIDAGGLDDLVTAGREVDTAAVDERRAAAVPTDLATIIYTSGTTGRPKGCELTHANFIESANNTVEHVPTVFSTDGASTVLFLPLAHVFARYVQVAAIRAGARMGYCPDVSQLMGTLASFQPSFLLSVPRVFEKIYNASEAKAEAAGRGAIFRQAAQTAIAWSRAQEERGGRPSLGLRVQHALFDRLVYGKMRAAMGGRITCATSGGAPLGERLAHFFRGAGIAVLEGYGLTETTAPATTNTPERTKIGTVGAPLPGVAVRIADDGEILIRGVNVMRGYWQNPEATARSLTDGWLHTGDLGSIDDEGFITITGRKKEILVTAGGKNVAPAVLEDHIRAHPLVSQCIVVGDQRPFIGALITLDADMLPLWLSNHQHPALDVAAAAELEAVRTEVQLAVDAANRTVSRAESIRSFRLLTIDFTEQSGHLTPSMKLKRAAVMKDFAVDVEELYR
ncbi:MAG: AMP-dependent synthetase/ligase [Angustibacter sp.]